MAVLLAEALTGDEPFADARNDVAIALRVRDGERPALPKSTPRQLREALMRCWDSNSAETASALRSYGTPPTNTTRGSSASYACELDARAEDESADRWW